MSENILAELKWRGLLEEVSDPALEGILAQQKLSVYAGFDPSSPSLQIGNLVGILALMRFQQAGHRPIALIGGATGMIGDPSGKNVERNLLTSQAVAENVAKIRRQLEHFLGAAEAETGVIIVDNADWLGKFSFIEFLRDVGKHFRLGYMLAKESVRRRISEGQEGMSFTEFAYMLLQGYDFVHLFNTHKCTLQIGGTDQWGNITAGIDLTRKLRSQTVYGLTWPLVTTADGTKFGKTEAGAIWLDAEMTSPYDFYQFWVRVDDRDAIKYLKYFTMLSEADIRNLAEQTATAPEKRRAQRVLADELTKLVHGEAAWKQAAQTSEQLFSGTLHGLSDQQLSTAFEAAPRTNVAKSRLQAGIPLIDILVETGLAKSRGAARRLINQGGAYVNNQVEKSIQRSLGLTDLASAHFIVLRTGKKNYHLLHFE
ncbi:MAG: tyrosine--tRNA ligase [Actinobacteria bacterium]|nr:tyrosine--tRNA ligase [Actinomycetota bacterium]